MFEMILQQAAVNNQLVLPNSVLLQITNTLSSHSKTHLRGVPGVFSQHVCLYWTLDSVKTDKNGGEVEYMSFTWCPLPVLNLRKVWLYCTLLIRQAALDSLPNLRTLFLFKIKFPNMIYFFYFVGQCEGFSMMSLISEFIWQLFDKYGSWWYFLLQLKFSVLCKFFVWNFFCYCI